MPTRPGLEQEARRDSSSLSINWVLQPPAPGSGGHTTIFRMAAAAERAGHRCTIYLHDRHGWDIDQHRAVIRSWWPEMAAPIRSWTDGMDDADVIMATSWDTAYLVRASTARGERCYFVQDFEPSFYPAGSEFLLAEATYRFGFRAITAGRWLAQVLRRDYGMDADHFDFGCDLSTYKSQSSVGDRVGICYYCRPSTPRRAHELALLALELFAERHPDVEVHFFGEPVGHTPFPITHHGLLSPVELGSLYARCVAGLTLSATNVSLVPYEMLAAGCVPVVNDAEHNRTVLANDHVRYAAATPWELADALSSLIASPVNEIADRARLVADSVTSTTWDIAGEQFVAAVERAPKLGDATS